MTAAIRTMLICTLIFVSCGLSAQMVAIQHQPGKIIRAARTTAGQDILDPVNRGWISASGTAWSINADDTSSSASEIHYRAIKPFGGEPCCDLRRGPDHRFTDFVPDANNNGVYLNYSAGGSDATSYLRIRMRMGSVIPGSKGFSLLIDTDSSFGISGSRPDANYVAQTTGVNGNKGFEIEVVLETGFRVAIYNVDGRGNPNDGIDTRDMASDPWRVFYDNDWEARSQVSFAATTESGDADYFIDWYVTLAELKLMKTSAVGTAFIQTAAQSLRIIPTTVMAPKPSVAGPVSDTYGAGDSIVISNMPPINLSANRISGICTNAPVLTSVGANGVVTGTWTKGSQGSGTATIYIYKNNDTTNRVDSIQNVATGATWSKTVTGLVATDTVFAKALGNGLYESKWCFQSNKKTVGSCATRPGPLTITTFADDRGILGSGYPGTVTGGTGSVYITMYKVSNSAFTRLGFVEFPLTTIASGNNARNHYNVDGTVNTTWYFNGGTGGPGNTQLTAGQYAFYDSTSTGCRSAPTFSCLASGASSSVTAGTTNAPTLTSDGGEIYTTSATISGAFGAGSITPAVVRIYLDSVLLGNATVTGGTSWSYTFTNQTLTAGKTVFIRSHGTEAGATYYCSGSLVKTIITACANKAPVFNIDSTTSKIGEGVIITGLGTPGGSVKVYKQPSNTQVGTTATVGNDGTWTSGYTATLVPVTETGYSVTLTTTGCATAATLSTVNIASKTTQAYCNGTLEFSANTLSSTGYSSVISAGVVTGTKLTSDARWLQGSLGGSVSANTKKVKIYLNDGIIGYYSIAGGTNGWGPIAVDSMLTQGDILTIAVTENNGSSEMICASTKIICDCATTNKPTRPTVSNTSTLTVASGQKATVIIPDPQDNNLYSIKNYYTGKALTRGVYYTGGNVTSNARGVRSGTGIENGKLLGTGETLTINQVPADSTQTVQIDAHRIGGTETCTDSTSFKLTTFEILPVVLSEFKGIAKEKRNILNWKTETEFDFSHFELEKSTDGNNFQKIAHIRSNGVASAYSFNDEDLVSTTNYYRLRMVDIDGKFKYSHTIVITVSGNSVVLNTVRPNPFTGNIAFSINLQNAQNIQVIMMDASGRIVKTYSAKAEKGHNQVWLNSLDNLSKGAYLLNIYADGNVYKEKLVKVN